MQVDAERLDIVTHPNVKTLLFMLAVGCCLFFCILDFAYLRHLQPVVNLAISEVHDETFFFTPSQECGS